MTLTYPFTFGLPTVSLLFEKPTLFCDIDNTLANLSDAMAVAVNSAFGTAYVAWEITTYKWSDVLPKQQGAWLNDQLNKPTLLRNLSPILPAIRCIQKAHAAGYTVRVVTDRDASLEGVTKEWLDHYNVPYDSLGMKIPGKTKVNYLDGYGPDNRAILLEDNPMYGYLLAGKPGITVMQPEWPYSKQIPGVELFDDWHYVKDRLGI